MAFRGHIDTDSSQLSCHTEIGELLLLLRLSPELNLPIEAIPHPC